MNVPSHFRALVILVSLMTLVAWTDVTLRAEDAGTAPTVRDRIIGEYLNGNWDEAEADIAANPRELTGPPTPARADLEYVRKTIAECRPAWWKQSKAGKKFVFRAAVWGHTRAFTFDPAGKTAIQLNYLNGTPSVTVMWDAADMDNPAQAEHGFTKGDLNDLTIWMVLGTSDSWLGLSLASQANLDESGRQLLSRYLDFRGNISGAYYGTPRARRWDLWLDLASYTEKYEKMTTVMSRKAVAAIFMEEVAAHPGKYPSIKLPDDVPEDGAEAKLAGLLKRWIEKNGFTLAEEQSLREAMKAFATANTANVRQSGKVTLPNGLVVFLDPQLDQPDAIKRNTWLHSQIKSAAK
jgi:hypothetical protein